MPRSKARDPRQLSLLEDLQRQLDEQPGELLPLEVTPEDIGGAILSILSKGLYTNPLDCIREYVQNAVDAQAKSVTIKITGNSVSIFDEGNGMDLADLVQARQFGVSLKSFEEHVGFRGIGIYSGFDLCRRLRLTTTQEDDPNLYVLVFEFSAMKAELEKDRKREPGEPKTSLSKLLSTHTYIKRESSPVSVNRHFTQVELQDISDVHIRQLSNRAEMKRYLLQSLPIDFADDFEYRDIISQKLRDNVPGYKAVRITLQSDGLPDETVAKDAIINLQPPEFGEIVTSANQKIGYYWACLNKERGRIQPKPSGKDSVADVRTSYEGFVYKVKGFTIGDRHKLREMFSSKPQLYPWYTGEIYVTDENVIPNAERDDFETNQAKRALEIAVRDRLERLEEEAERIQASGVANDRVTKYRDEVTEIEAQVENNTQANDFETYSRLDEILRDLRRQRLKADAEMRIIADDIIKRSDRLQKQLRKEVDSGTSESTRRKRAAKKDSLRTRPLVPVIESPPPVPIKTLYSILKDAGWELEGDCTKLIAYIQGSLEDVLSVGSAAYRNLLNDIEAKLISGNSDE